MQRGAYGLIVLPHPYGDGSGRPLYSARVRAPALGGSGASSSRSPSQLRRISGRDQG